MKKALANTEGKFKKYKEKNEQNIKQLLKIQKQVIQNNSGRKNRKFYISLINVNDYIARILTESDPGKEDLKLI